MQVSAVFRHLLLEQLQQSVEGYLAEQRLRLLCGDEEGRGGEGEGRGGEGRGGGGDGRGRVCVCYHGIQTVKSLLILRPL